MTVADGDGRQLARLVVEGDSFAMTAVRVLSGQRTDDPVSSGYRLMVRRGPGGGPELADPETGERLPLAGFGPDNAGVFAAWLERPPR